ncbi:cilia- and flagella-associated protein 418 isoform X1 [Nerophis ophidion]|uniref:cilia- and flagella-associated protein 418 isoform X1 n=1 Tax=Nerophis ophidion TaxID=159077 RepID=UPI002AE06E11|nr:cilia- and flagella-associated protein 418 isoform X1 [Nerophis ophidion]
MDGDDLDVLLDEVEKKFCHNVSVTADRPVGSEKDRKCEQDNRRGTSKESTHGDQTGNITEDIDALLEELKDEDHGDSPLKRIEHLPKARRAEQMPPCQFGGRKCCPVYLGGSAIPNGVGTATSKRSCDELRCTSCDFRVLTFDDWEWDPSCDYLFLRNNMPDHDRLRAKLRKRSGARAYACQCSWLSACSLDPTDVLLQPQLKWVCGKHLD